MARHLRNGLSSLAVLALLSTACGDDGEQTDAGPTSTAGPSDGGSSTTAAPEVTTTEAAPTTAAPTTTTTDPPLTGPTPTPLADIPDLVVAWSDGTADPLELAQGIIGFPLAIPTPDNTTPLHISVDVFGGDPESPWEWEWTYEVLSSDPIPDIDIHTEEPSPGEVALRDLYDPIMADLGLTYSNSTGSDPGDEGGPNSINHVYTSAEETLVVNGLTATPNPVFAWADEEQVFGEGVPGYQIDVSYDFDPAVIPVPLIQALVDELPEIAGAQLVDAGLLSWNRPDTSFDAEYGLRYFEVSLEWALPPGAAEDAKTTFSTGLSSTSLFAGEESFFDPGFREPAEPRVFDDRWTQPIVFLDRYKGAVEITGNEAGEATLEVRVTFEPNRVVLEELPG